MSTIPVQEIKRRGMKAVDEALVDGPVHLVKSNRAQYVVMSEQDYLELMRDLTEARLAASEADLREGRVRRGDAKKLMKILVSEE
jgi:PHD/YefM family antitoxin component YafN of YafNO toxin-antitoxin module